SRSRFRSWFFLSVHRKPIDAAHMIPPLLRCDANGFDSCCAKFRSVAVSLGHLKATRAVNLISSAMPAEKSDFMIGRFPTIKAMKSRDDAWINVRRLRFEPYHQSRAGHLPGVLIDEPPTPVL